MCNLSQAKQHIARLILFTVFSWQHLLLVTLPFPLLRIHISSSFCQELRPSYNLPSRHQVSGTLLSKVDALVLRVMKSKLWENYFITLITDGWKNMANQNCVSWIVVDLFCNNHLLSLQQSSVIKTNIQVSIRGFSEGHHTLQGQIPWNCSRLYN